MESYIKKSEFYNRTFRLNPKSYKVLCFFLAAFFSILLTSLPVDGLVDRASYLLYPSNSPILLLQNFSLGLFPLLANEPLWLAINSLLSIFISAENVIRAIIAFSSFTTFYLALKNTNVKYFYIVILFLLLPLVLKNNLIHLRQGFGVAIFLIGWFSTTNKVKYFFYICAALIHSSFIVILFGILGVNFLMFLKLSHGIRSVMYLFIGIVVGLAGLYLAQFIGARQGGEYSDSASQNASGLGFIYWGFVLVLFVMQGKVFLRYNTQIIFFLILYLSTYFILPVTARIFESVVLLVLLASLRFKVKYKRIFQLVFCLYFFLVWSLHFRLEGFGWFVS